MKTSFFLSIFSLFLFLTVSAQTESTLPLSIAVQSINKLHFINALTGYAASSHSYGGGYILKTVNSGANWMEYPSDCISEITDLTFVNQNTGYCCSLEGEVAITTNGGENWTRIYRCLNNHFFTIGMINNFIGFMYGQGSFVRILDGGCTWTRDYSQQYIMSSAVLSSKAMICGITDGPGPLPNYGIIMYSTNSGASWLGASTNADMEEITLNDIFFLNQTEGFVTGDKGNLQKSTDGGLNWSVMPKPTYKAIFCVYFLNSLTGFVGGENFLLRTTDGGVNFTTNLNPMIRNIVIKDINFFDSNNGIFCGYNGTSGIIFKTSDGGLNWAQVIL